MNSADWERVLANEETTIFEGLYDDADDAVRRYRGVLRELCAHYPAAGTERVRFVSTPGRTELAGNHTDHNRGRVIAASVQLDAVAAVFAVPGDSTVRLYSIDYGAEFVVDLADLEPRPGEKGRTEALIRGTAAWFSAHGLRIGGFRAAVQSRVFSGSGLSSSACFEVLIATVFDLLYNDSGVDPVRRALCGQFAENRYFGKPSGLMDQLACSYGGVVGIDFSDPDEPKIDAVQADFAEAGYRLAIVDSRSGHEAGVDDYASIPTEMRTVAAVFGCEVLGEVDPDEFWTRFSDLRGEVPGRALARAAHFFTENARVANMLAALKKRPIDIAGWLELAAESGGSSFKYLQNIVDASGNQDYALTLLACEVFAGSMPSVARVHGGGFGGTVQVYVHKNDWDGFTSHIATVLGGDRVTPLAIRSRGSIEIIGRNA